MTGYASTGRSYVAVADAGGTLRDLSPWVERAGPLGLEFAGRDVTGVNDTAARTVAGPPAAQEFTVSGRWDDTPIIGPDAVLAGVVGRSVAVEYGPVGQRTGPTARVGDVRVPVLSHQQPGERTGAVRGNVPAGRAGGAREFGDGGGSVRGRNFLRGNDHHLAGVVVVVAHQQVNAGVEVD